MHQRCPLSKCETQPHYCGVLGNSSLAREYTHVESAELTTINFIVLLPIVLAVAIPVLNTRLKFKDDSILRRSMLNGQELDLEGLRIAREPRMILCGFMPKDCGATGLLTVVSIMVSVFVVTFYLMLLADWPCTTGLGRCRTISCICGNVIQEGYVFMFCCLTLTSALIVQRISVMPHHPHWWHKSAKLLLIIGSLLITLTGCFPERYDVNGQNSGPLVVLYRLHLLGVFGSGVLLMGLPFIWFASNWLEHRDVLDGAEYVPLLSIACRTLHVATALAMGIAMMVYTDSVVDETVDYCTYLKTKAACEAWPTMSPENCTVALDCVAGVMSAGGPSCSTLLQPNFRCSWEDSPLTLWTQMIAPPGYVQDSSCIKVQCPLFRYARGVALEFAVLLLTLCYVPTFAFHDLEQLFAKAPKSADTERSSSVHAGSVAPISWNGSMPSTWAPGNTINASSGVKNLPHHAGSEGVSSTLDG